MLPRKTGGARPRDQGRDRQEEKAPRQAVAPADMEVPEISVIDGAFLDCELPDDFELVTATGEEIRRTVQSCIAEFPHDPRQFTTSVAVQETGRR